MLKAKDIMTRDVITVKPEAAMKELARLFIDNKISGVPVVDDEGGIIWGDQLMVFFARDILAEKPGAIIIADVKASNVLFDEIRKAGGNAARGAGAGRSS